MPLVVTSSDKISSSLSLKPGQSSSANQQIQSDQVRLHLQMLFGIVSRKRWFLLSFVIISAMISGIFVVQIEPLYSAETQLVLETQRPVSISAEALLGGPQIDSLSNETEAAILTSTTLADRVIAKLELTKSSFFTKKSDNQQEDANAKRDILNTVYTQYFRNLTVHPGDRSRVMQIRFVANNPQLAADVANTLAQVFIEENSESRHESAMRETFWLTERVDELRGRVKDAQRRVEEFKSAHGVLDIGSTSILQRQIADYNQQLTTAQIQRADLDEKAEQLALLERNGLGIGMSEAALDSANIRQLRDTEVTASRRVADLGKLYRDGHPALIQAKAELAEVEAKLRAELGRILHASQNLASLAREHEDRIAAKLDSLTKELQQQAKTEESLNVLQVDLKTTTDFYATLLNRLREANSLDERINPPHARIISTATPPDVAFYPRKAVIIASTTSIAALVAIMIAFLMEALDVGFRNAQQIEASTGLETVASLPKLKMLVWRQRLADIPKLFETEQLFAESVRYARVGLSLSSDLGRSVRSILVTSSVPQEGKTFASRVLAVTFAQGGAKVITVNCDLRKRPVWRQPSESGKKGLADYLQGLAEIGEIINKDPVSGAHYIECGAIDGCLDAPMLLGSDRMRVLLRTLAEDYDMSILDTPPVKIFPDALVLQQWVDRVYFLVRWAKTRREIVVDALRVIVQAGHLHPVIGLTQVNLRQLPRFDYTAAYSHHNAPEYLTRRRITR